MKPLKQKVSLTLDEDLIAKLRVLAEDCDRSLSQYINVTLKEHVAKLEQQKKAQKYPGCRSIRDIFCHYQSICGVSRRGRVSMARRDKSRNSLGFEVLRSCLASFLLSSSSRIR